MLVRRRFLRKRIAWAKVEDGAVVAETRTDRHVCARAIFRDLKKRPEGMSTEEMCRRFRVSDRTLRNARTILEERGIPLKYDGSSRRWKLDQLDHEDPVLDPSDDDLTLLVLGAALLGPFVDSEMRARVHAAVGAVRHELRPQSQQPRSPAVRSSVTMRSTVDPRTLRKVLDNVQHGVLRLSYYTPWEDRHEQHVAEPWALQLVDGATYLRAYSQKRSQPRTFHLGFVTSCVVEPRKRPTQPVPRGEELWGDVGFGVDEHFPGTATVRFRGPVARWLARIEWHPSQHDVGPGADGVLERSVPYRSRREFARKLLSYADAIAGIEPADLRAEVLAAMDTLQRAIGTPKSEDGK